MVSHAIRKKRLYQNNQGNTDLYEKRNEKTPNTNGNLILKSVIKKWKFRIFKSQSCTEY